jgi:hypothetical protein
LKKLLALVLAISTTGCASTDWLLADERHGLRPGDPCVRCGEKIIQLPNHPFEAQIRWQRGERW